MGEVEGRGFISGWGKKPLSELPVIELQVKPDRLICIGCFYKTELQILKIKKVGLNILFIY